MNNEKCTDEYFECSSSCDIDDAECEETCVEELKECPIPDWRDEMKGYTSNSMELELLENGPKSWMQAMRLGALHNKWKKMKGIKDPEPPDCQSSFNEFSSKYGS